MQKPSTSVIAGTVRARPADLLRRYVRAGLIAPIIVAVATASVETFEISRECGGAFNRGFGAGLDRHHCELVIRLLKIGYQIKVPLP
jgi:hypothetical protein